MERIIEQLLEGFQIPLQNPVLIFSLILAIILLAPILLRRINIPSIIGLIISGTIIGPHGLNILEKNSAVDLFSTIGLLYIMFIAGLELDLNEFKANRFKSILFGFFTFTIPIAIGFPVIYYGFGYELLPSLLISSMFATHTLVAYPIVSKLGVSKNQAVAITVGGTILTDTGVLIALATIVGVNEGAVGNEFWLQLGLSLLLFSAFMFLVVPRIAKWFFRKLESEKHSHYIFVLAVVFFAAFMAEAAGLEPIIGAFAAGLALNKLIPHTSSLMNRIEFIGNSLFIPFFLISVGMLIDVTVLFSGYRALLIAGILSVVALFGKWIAAFFSQVIFKYSRTQRQLIFGLSSSHAAAILAVVLVGMKAGLVDETILNGTIILILVTCIVASFVTERAAKKMVLESEDPANSHSVKTRNEHIIIPVKKTANLEKLIDFVALIKDRRSLQPVSLLAVVPNDDDAEIQIIKAQTELEKYISYASASETRLSITTTIDAHFLSGAARKSREIMAEIVMLPWPDKGGFSDRKSDLKVDTILQHIDKPLFICHINKPISTHKRIFVAAPPFCEKETDFGLWMQKSLQLAQELTLNLVFFCNDATRTAIARHLLHGKSHSVHELRTFDDWDDFLILARFIREDDLLLFIGARKGSFSYQQVLDQIPQKLEKYFSRNSRILMFPGQISSRNMIESYQDITHEPINKGLEAVQKIGKEIGNIFKKEE